MFLLPSSTMYLQVDIICFEALSACSAILFFAECFKTQKKIFRISLIVIALISALIALIYRYGLGVRVIRSKYPRSKIKEDFNYNLWSKILRRYVSPKSGRVNYNGLIKRRHLIEEFIAMLAVFGPSSTPCLFQNKCDKIAYWINVYNALVIFAIIEYLPNINSILDIKTGFCCCSSSDYHLYYKNKKRKRKKRKYKKRMMDINNNNNNNYDGSIEGEINGNNININRNNDNNNKPFGTLNISYNKKKHELLIEDKDNDQIICILNEKKRQEIKQKKIRKQQSINNLKRSYWFFEALRFEIDGSLYSLREIERDILCDKLGCDARIYCCLNRGCIGSPKLLNKPFESHLLHQQLNEMNKLFCSGLKIKDLCIQQYQRNICISNIFKYYKDDYIKYAKKNKWNIGSNHCCFNKEDSYLLGYIYHFANKEMKNKLSFSILSNHTNNINMDQWKIKYIEFDWRINKTKRRKKKDKNKHKYHHYHHHGHYNKDKDIDNKLSEFHFSQNQNLNDKTTAFLRALSNTQHLKSANFVKNA